jgi:hypothetical protein
MHILVPGSGKSHEFRSLRKKPGLVESVKDGFDLRESEETKDAINEVSN